MESKSLLEPEALDLGHLAPMHLQSYIHKFLFNETPQPWAQHHFKSRRGPNTQSASLFFSPESSIGVSH